MKAVNPLLNPLVITEVYKYLDLPNKKSFRLVCKTWIDTILDLWRKQSKLVIEHEKYSEGQLNLQIIKHIGYSFPGRPNPPTDDFILEYLNLYKIAEKPLLNLELVNFEFSFLPDDVLQSGGEKEIARFLQIRNVQNLLATHFGHSLERLELEICIFLQEDQFEVGFNHILLKSFSKLKVLSVRQPRIIENSGHKLSLNSFPQSNLVTLNLDGKQQFKLFKQETVQRIFNLIPNLKNLSLRGPACELITALSAPLSSSGSHIPLERLRIDEVYATQLFEIPAWIKSYLETARPPLKCLKASLLFGAFPHVRRIEFPEVFTYKPIWNCVGNTLTSINLRIILGGWNWCTLFTGCSLPKLTNLCLLFRETNKLDELLHFDFGMLRGTPLLKRMHLVFEIMDGSRFQAVGSPLEGHELEWSGNTGNDLRGAIVLEHMEDFRFELYHKPTLGCWRVFAEMMPNLRKLQGIVDEDTEPLVRQLWPDLNLICSSLLRQSENLNSGDFVFGTSWEERDWEDWEGRRNLPISITFLE